MSIRKGTTQVDTFKTNEKIGGEYRNQLVNYLVGDIQEDLSRTYGQFVQRLDIKNKEIVIKAYERSMKELGLDPNTQEVLDEVQHNQNALYLRLCTRTSSIFSFDYKQFKICCHVIDNKEKYIGCQINEEKIYGIGKNSICTKDQNGNKKFHWFTFVPLRYCGSNTDAQGLPIAKKLIELYGE